MANNEHIQNSILTIRGVQVILDSDLAMLYHVETRILNQAVKRNIKRFPKEFMFQLTVDEYSSLKSQNVISNGKRGGRRKLPYAFTEQGVSMLSAILKSDIAIDVSIKIINAFVGMRKFLNENAQIFQRFDTIEQKLLKHDDNFNKIFQAIESHELSPKQGIFFEGQIFDAYLFVSQLVKSAKKSIRLIDNYVDETVLVLFRKNPKISVTIYSKYINKQLKLDVDKYNSQYHPIVLKKFKSSHDRFMIIDEKHIYHFGASLKDLGKKWFAFSKFDIEALGLINRLEKS